MNQHPNTERERQLAAKLVMLSHIFGWGGIGFLFLLGPVLLATVNVPLGGIVCGLGALAALAGGILGQVGRGMQGRVI